MLQIKNIYKKYKYKSNNADGFSLGKISLDFSDTGFVAITGKSGSGKTTLLNIISTLDSATSGEIIINGNVVNKDINIDTYRNKCISFIFQRNNLFAERSVYSNISTPLIITNEIIEKNKLMNILINLGVEGFKDKKIKTLSGGQEQRISIARALVKDTPIIFADEPTANLDDNNSENIFAMLKEISKTKLVIMVSHDIERCYKYVDRIITLSDGMVTQDIVRNPQINNNFIEVETNGYITPEIIRIMNNENKKLAIGYECKFEKNTLKSKENLVKETSYTKSSPMSLRNVFALTGISIFNSKLKSILMIIVSALLIGFFGLSMHIINYDSSIATSMSYANNPTDKLILMQGSDDQYGNIVKDNKKMNNDTINYIKNNYDKNMVEIKKISGMNILISSVENLDIIPSEITGILEIEESDISILGFSLMNFPYVDENHPAIESRFPSSGYPVAVNSTEDVKVNEVVITDYLAYILYKEYFKLDLDKLPEPENPKISKLENFLYSGFERIFIELDVLSLLPNSMKIVGIFDTGYKTKYLDILEDNYSLSDKLFQEFVTEVKTCHSLAYSAEGFAESCYTNNFQGEFHCVTTSSSQYMQYLSLNKITYINGFDGVLRANDVIIDIQAFEKYTGVTFSENSSVPYKFLDSYDNIDFTKLNIIGIIDTRQNQLFSTNGLIISNELLQQLAAENSYVIGAWINVNEDLNTRKLFKFLSDNSIYTYIQNSDIIAIATGNITNLKYIFLPITIVIAVLSILVMGVFLSSHILGKKYEYGIYRCFGASRVDVVKYIIFEIVIFLLIIISLATLFMWLFLQLTNNLLITTIGSNNIALLNGVTLLYNSPLPYLLVTIGILFIGTLLSIYPFFVLSKFSPVESIRRAD